MELQITSRTNSRVKELLKNRDQYFFFEGEKLVQDILNREIPIKRFIINDKYNPHPFPKTGLIEETWYVTGEVMEKISSLKEAPVVIAVLKWQVNPVDFNRAQTIIALDNIQDPANAGTVFRCASAFGINDIAITGKSVKLNNSKFLRTAQHTIFDINCHHYESARHLIHEAEETGFNIYLTSSHGPALTVEPEQIEQPALILLGNEGKGLNNELFGKYPSIKIPQTNRVESLNAGVSACIIMYEVSRSRKI